MTRLFGTSLILLMLGCIQIKPSKKADFSVTTKQDTILLSQYRKLMEKVSGNEIVFISDLVSTMTTFQGRELDTTILLTGFFDTDNILDTISTRIFDDQDTIWVNSTWTKNTQVLWSNKFKDPYLWINNDTLFEIGKRSKWVTFTIGYKHAVPIKENISKYQDLLHLAVDFGLKDLAENGIIIDKESYRKYLSQFKNDLLTWGHPESREGTFMWYENAKRFVLYYHE